MKRMLLAAVAAATFVGNSSAADLRTPAYKAPPPAAVIIDPWTGWFVGGKIGYGFDLSGMTASQPPFFDGAQLSTAPQGVTGGVQAGYNYRLTPFLVAGIEADINGGALKGTASAPQFITGKSELNWFGSVGARLGITPFQNLLIYGFGGLAFGDPTHTFTLSNFVNTGAACVGQCSVSTSGTKTGPAWGFGAEFALDQHWKFQVDWRRYDFGSSNLSMTPDGTTAITFNPQNWFDVISGGFNYSF